MITVDKLREIATKNQTTQLNVRREYVQHVFLSYFYRQKQSGTVFFKGGTALRLLYRSPRFSEDLDFSTAAGNISAIEDAVQNTLVEVEREGIQTEIVESKKTTGGYLMIVAFSLAGEKVALQAEVSFRDTDARGEIFTVAGEFIPPYTVMGLKQEQLIEQKMNALLSRQKPRDFYDLYFILRANLLPPQAKKVLPQVLKVLKETKISFDKELEQFLPRNHWAQIKDLKSALAKEIQKFV